MISLTILFIKKLIVVYRKTYNSDQNIQNNEHEKGLLAPITRLTVLVTLSLSSTCLLVISQVIRGFYDNQGTRFLVYVVGSSNLYINFVNAMLANKMFKHWYKRICGLLDMKCRECWMRWIHDIEDEVQLLNIIGDNEKSFEVITSPPATTEIKIVATKSDETVNSE